MKPDKVYIDLKKAFIGLCEKFQFVFLLLYGLIKRDGVPFGFKNWKKRQVKKFLCVFVMQKNVIKKIMDISKTIAIFIVIVKDMVTFCTFVAANNTRLLHPEMTGWSNNLRIQLLEKIKFVIFVLKLIIYLLSRHLSFVWTRCLISFRST